jgi:transposase-like protein
MGARKSYTGEFKARVVLEMLKEEKTVAQLSSEHGIHASVLHQWKAAAIEALPETLSDKRHQNGSAKREAAEQEQKVQELYAQIGRLTTQLSWLKKKSGVHDLPV